jgi:hypothetical protein
MAVEVEPNRVGLMFYGLSGPAAAPFLGGIRCVETPITRTAAQVSTGGGLCGGQFMLDFNSYAYQGSDTALTGGVIVYAQYWFRDPGDTAYGTGLTEGIEFQMCP